jgi:hypothetical protein
VIKSGPDTGTRSIRPAASEQVVFHPVAGNRALPNMIGPNLRSSLMSGFAGVRLYRDERGHAVLRDGGRLPRVAQPGGRYGWRMSQ